MSGDIPMIHGYEEQHGDQAHDPGDVRQVIERLRSASEGWRPGPGAVEAYPDDDAVATLLSEAADVLESFTSKLRLHEAYFEGTENAVEQLQREREVKLTAHPAPSGWQQRIAAHWMSEAERLRALAESHPSGSAERIRFYSHRERLIACAEDVVVLPCSCPTTCDCANPEPRVGAGAVSEECPVHNVKPKPALTCPVHGEDALWQNAVDALPPEPEVKEAGPQEAKLASRIVAAIDALPQDYNEGWQTRAIPVVEKILADAKDAIPSVSEEATAKCVIGEYCRRHQFIHGAEAEELRSRVEALLERGLTDDSLRRLLDDVDARDSLAFVEATKRGWCEECDASVCKCGHCECAHTFPDDLSGQGCTECKTCDGFEEADASPLKEER